MIGTGYEILVVDPPWQKSKGGLRNVRSNQGKRLDYETMQTADIFKLLDEEIFAKTAEVHCVFIWTIEDYLLECENYMHQRRYKRHCRMVWDKMNGIAPAFTIRYSHEYLLWYYKLKLLPIATGQRGKFKTVFQERAREHSRKPELSYNMIEAIYPDKVKIDVFSRQSRSGWQQFGNQTNFFDTKLLDSGLKF